MSARSTCNKDEVIKSWLNSIDESDFDGEDKTCPSIAESSIIASSSSSESGEELVLVECRPEKQINGQGNILPEMTALTFNNVNIANSTNVYLGHIYKVNGNLNINVIHNKDAELEESPTLKSDVLQQTNSQVTRPACLIFPRYRWLAMDPLMEPKKVLEPVDFIIIGYTGTTSSMARARNIGIIRDYQTFNVEAQGFNDIIYNFLIGCDGIVYEGRGWGVEGDHTIGYNDKSIGIAFVGNFKRDLPAERVFKACRNLIKRGVHEGHISEYYKILTSRQCSDNSNSDVLHEELKKWDRFCEIHSDQHS